MSENDTKSQHIVSYNNSELDIPHFQELLIGKVEALELPSKNVFVEIQQRAIVFNNIEGVISLVNPKDRPNAIYFSKFLAAVAVGLFDAALNYLWDQTIMELRHRIAQYDLSYFYDIVINDSKKRDKVDSAEHLVQISDDDLIRGARDIELISDIGYKHLDNIRYMRNWASAAHPNNNQITGLQLISWLETCIREVINLPLSSVTVEIKKLLENIKKNRISIEEAKTVGGFFITLTQERIDTLCSGFFGLYTNINTSTQTQQNIQHLLPYLWDRVSEKTRQELGIKYAQFLARNEQHQEKLAKEFLGIVSAYSYMPDIILISEIDTAIENLISAHRGANNFYNEPPFARQLQIIVGNSGKIPFDITYKYVTCLIDVFITNGNGVAWGAEPLYIDLIQQFDTKQSIIAILSFMDEGISSKLQFSLCKRKFEELLDILRNQTPIPAIHEFIDYIKKQNVSFENLREISKVKERVENLKKIL